MIFQTFSCNMHRTSTRLFLCLEVFKKKYFLFKINIFISFLCVDIKNNFFKIKKYYFNVFQMKNTLKHNYYKHRG
jgi:hypothetical protein